jgi:thiol-disulfide isomerase/thioredoxin
MDASTFEVDTPVTAFSEVGIRLKPAGGLPPLAPTPPTPTVSPSAPLMPRKLDMDLKHSLPSPPPASAASSTQPKDVNILKLSKPSMLKNSYLYRTMLFLTAFAVVLFMTKKYWWNFVVKRFFPTDQKPKAVESPHTFEIKETDALVDVAEKDAAEVLKPAPYAKVLLIYATWCTHCEHMMGAFEEAAAKVASDLKLKPDSHKVVFMRAEAGAVPTLSNRPSVPGFPTIVGIFQNGKEFPYSGPRNADSFVKFAELVAVGGLEVGEAPPPVMVKPRTYVRTPTATDLEKEGQVTPPTVPETTSSVEETLDDEEFEDSATSELKPDVETEMPKEVEMPAADLHADLHADLPADLPESVVTPSVKTRKSKKELKL